MRASFLIALFLPLLLSACASSAPRPATLDDLLGTWQLDAAIPIGSRVPTLTIQRDGSVHGNGGVNTYRSSLDTAALARGQWRAHPAMATRMAGPQESMALEHAFLEAIGRADAVEIDGQRLRLLQGKTVTALLIRPSF
jgi:heat shock protein HslJ